MSHVDRVVNTQSNGKYYRHTGNDINGHVPEVEKANNVGQSEDYTGEDNDTDAEVGKEDEGDDHDGC